MKTYLENKNKLQTKINMTKRKLKWNKSTSIMKHGCVSEPSHPTGLAPRTFYPPVTWTSCGNCERMSGMTF